MKRDSQSAPSSIDALTMASGYQGKRYASNSGSLRNSAGHHPPETSVQACSSIVTLASYTPSPVSLHKNLTYSASLSSLQPLCQGSTCSVNLPSPQHPALSFSTLPSISIETMCKYNAMMVFNVLKPSSKDRSTFAEAIQILKVEVIKSPEAVVRYRRAQDMKVRRIMCGSPTRRILCLRASNDLFEPLQFEGL